VLSGIAGLAGFSGFCDVLLSQNDLDDAFVDELCSKLETTSSVVQRLVLDENRITGEGAFRLIDFLNGSDSSSSSVVQVLNVKKRSSRRAERERERSREREREREIEREEDRGRERERKRYFKTYKELFCIRKTKNSYF